MTTPGRAWLLAAAAIALVALLAPASAALSAGIPGPEDPLESISIGCEQGAAIDTDELGEQLSPRVYVEREADKTRTSTDVTGDIAGIPPRYECHVQPSTALPDVPVRFQNRTGRTVDMRIDAVDLAGASDGTSFVEIVEPGEGEFGAAGWLEVPEGSYELEHGDTITVMVRVRVPADAPPGAHYTGIRARVDAEGGTAIGGTNTGVSAGVTVQLLFELPGAALYGGELTSVEQPRLVWRELGDAPLVPLEATWDNQGQLTDELEGEVTFEGLFGTSVDDIPLESQIVARGGERDWRVYWRDAPWIGRFTPRIELTNRAGDTFTRELQPIWVLPAWYLIVAAIVVAALPIWWTRRRRRQLLELYERLDRAEARQWDEGLGDDEAWHEHDEDDELVGPGR